MSSDVRLKLLTHLFELVYPVSFHALRLFVHRYECIAHALHYQVLTLD